MGNRGTRHARASNVRIFRAGCLVCICIYTYIAARFLRVASTPRRANPHGKTLRAVVLLDRLSPSSDRSVKLIAGICIFMRAPRLSYSIYSCSPMMYITGVSILEIVMYKGLYISRYI